MEMFLDKVNRTVTPIAALIFAAFSLAAKDYQPFIQYSVAFIGVSISMVLLFPVGKVVAAHIKKKFFPKRLTKEQETRLSTLLKDGGSYMSGSHAWSPFYIWFSSCQTLKVSEGMAREYHAAIHSQFVDMRSLVKAAPEVKLLLLESLSFSIRSAVRAAEQAGLAISQSLDAAIVGDNDRCNIKSSWNACALQFNHWVNDWARLFKDSNLTLDLQCVECFSLLKTID